MAYMISGYYGARAALSSGGDATFYLLLGILVIAAAVWLGGQWLYGAMDTPEEKRLRSLKALSQGRRPRDGWGNK